jgi:serine/threonine protein phosphatase PrpC
VSEPVLILDGASAPHCWTGEAGGGIVCAYTCRAPDKLTENEDTVAIIPYGSDAVVLVVADGAGGLPAGKRASIAAATSLGDVLRQAESRTAPLRNAILDGIDVANAAVRDLGNGAATTLTVVTVEATVARSYQIGDSEAVIVGQRGRVRLQTMPHSPTGFAVEAGFLDQCAALHHDERHLVSDFLGTPDMRIDIGTQIDLMPRDTVLLASDGLMDNVHFDEIISRVRVGPIDAALDKVVRLALRRMADNSSGQPSKPDDLSLILFRKPYRQASAVP